MHISVWCAECGHLQGYHVHPDPKLSSCRMEACQCARFLYQLQRCCMRDPTHGSPEEEAQRVLSPDDFAAYKKYTAGLVADAKRWRT